MHPVIDAALVQHSAVFGNAMARLARSAGPIIRALYDPTGAELRWSGTCTRTSRARRTRAGGTTR
ncbi:hypothetical protein [Rhodococcus jostii]|uniref:Uncharacterized protein n=1 Tax=Rhodococcus jostii TaxID=132919 RepID=A0ABU4CG00_RHOJO|nr:hypothetical protein [Rhodococcus jostii]MDV6282476.1 hypothetical protein [Rhodococcus jostii]